MKKILHISYNNDTGAGTIPMLFHTEMEKRGYFSRILLHGRNARKSDHIIAHYGRWRILLHQINLGIHKLFSLYGSQKYYFFNLNERDNYIPAKSILNKINFEPDIIIFYWTSRFINTKTIRELHHATKAKLFWVLTDMAPYTGGCHYAWDCSGFEHNCQQCPAVENPAKAENNLNLKKKHLQDIPITIIASSGDSINFAKRSALFNGKPIIEYLHKVNVSSAKDLSKKQARSKLGLSEFDIIIYLGASDLNDERKGLKYLIEATKILHEKIDIEKTDRICIVYSARKKVEQLESIPFKTHALGFINFKNQLPLAFISSDICISPSVMDTGPYMINLALAHGCPLISFDVGVAKSLVVNRHTGFKAKEISPESLANSIHDFTNLTNDELDQIRNNCLKLASEKLKWKKDSLDLFGLN